jgi:hypothetical protein
MLIFGGVFVFLVRRLRAFDADKLENLFPAVNTKSENLFPKKRGEFAQPAHGANSLRSWLMALLGMRHFPDPGLRCLCVEHRVYGGVNRVSGSIEKRPAQDCRWPSGIAVLFVGGGDQSYFV